MIIGSGITVGSGITTTGGASVITAGLQLYLDAGNASSYPGSGTTWTDLSGNSRDGTLTNGPTYSSADGGSIVFDGTDDYLTTNISGTDFPNGVISVNLWVRLNSASTNRGIYQFSYDGSGGTYPWNALSIKQ